MKSVEADTGSADERITPSVENRALRLYFPEDYNMIEVLALNHFAIVFSFVLSDRHGCGRRTNCFIEPSNGACVKFEKLSMLTVMSEHWRRARHEMKNQRRKEHSNYREVGRLCLPLFAWTLPLLCYLGVDQYS